MPNLNSIPKSGCEVYIFGGYFSREPLVKVDFQLPSLRYIQLLETVQRVRPTSHAHGWIQIQVYLKRLRLTRPIKGDNDLYTASRFFLKDHYLASERNHRAFGWLMASDSVGGNLSETQHSRPHHATLGYRNPFLRNDTSHARFPRDKSGSSNSKIIRSVWIIGRPLSQLVAFERIIRISGDKFHRNHWAIVVTETDNSDIDPVFRFNRGSSAISSETVLGSFFELNRRELNQNSLNFDPFFTLSKLREDWPMVQIKYVGSTTKSIAVIHRTGSLSMRLS